MLKIINSWMDIGMRQISRLMDGVINRFIRRTSTRNDPVECPVELSSEAISLIRRIRSSGLTMTSKYRLFATALACKHVVDQCIEGDFVECGVWRGGNSILAASMLNLTESRRRIFLFDTFSGMAEPSAEDCEERTGEHASIKYHQTKTTDGSNWCFASLNDVKTNFLQFGIQEASLRFIVGDVCSTLGDETNLPEKIAILRLDTDWYESTRKELECLYPRLVRGGILLIDDYGHWKGARKAVEEYFESSGFPRPFFHYCDFSGRVGVKP